MGRYIQNRLVPDPTMSDSEFYHQRSLKAGPNVGKVYVQENAVTRIGALCFIKKRLQHHEIAAERFKSEYEALYGSGVPAMDNSRPVVDTSPVAHDSGMAGKVDRGRRFSDLIAGLGKERTDKLVALLVLCEPVSMLADLMPGGQRNQRQVAALESDRLLALDDLSAIWGYRSAA